jgi:hypothetical protein
MVYLIQIEQMLLSILLKSVVLVVVLSLVSLILSVNPIKIIKVFVGNEKKLKP